MLLEKLDEAPVSRRRIILEIAALVIFAGLITAFVEYGLPFLVQ